MLSAVQRRAELGEALDVVSVCWDVQRASRADGPGPGLAAVRQAVETSCWEDADYLGRQVAANLLRRAAINAADSIRAAAANPGLTVPDLLHTVEVMLQAIEWAAEPLTDQPLPDVQPAPRPAAVAPGAGGVAAGDRVVTGHAHLGPTPSRPTRPERAAGGGVDRPRSPRRRRAARRWPACVARRRPGRTRHAPPGSGRWPGQRPRRAGRPGRPGVRLAPPGRPARTGRLLDHHLATITTVAMLVWFAATRLSDLIGGSAASGVGRRPGSAGDGPLAATCARSRPSGPSGRKRPPCARRCPPSRQ